MGTLPLWDWLFVIIGIVCSLYIGVTWYGVDLDIFGMRFHLVEQVMRQGNPADIDIFFGTALIIVLLEAVRRTLGMVVPIIIGIFTVYAIFGPYMPLQILMHPGISWAQFINNMYFPAEGIFGVTLWIVSTVVFHFVLFGVLAQRMGLGQFFVDIAAVILDPPLYPLYRRNREGERCIFCFLRHHFRLLNCQHCLHRVPDNSEHETDGVSGASGWRCRGCVQCGRPDNAANHGGGGLRHGRISGNSIHDRRRGGYRSGINALYRRTFDGAFSGQAAFDQGYVGRGNTKSLQSSAPGVADSATACGTDLCVVQRLLAEHGGILGNFYGRCGRASQS